MEGRTLGFLVGIYVDGLQVGAPEGARVVGFEEGLLVGR